MAFCVNCGQELVEGAKFCANCGKSVEGNSSNSQRKTTYDGEIHKCPNCGEVLGAFISVCPSCGYELRGVKASNSVREFAARLADMQNDAQKIVVIQSFPIPNNKEDILEFMILASTCFDSKENLTGSGVKKDISDAWLAKVEQSYQKAKLLFFNDADFSKIQKVYEQTYNKVKISADTVKKTELRNIVFETIGLWGGLIVLIIGFIIDVSSPLANTSVFHLGGAAIMIIGSLIIGKKSNNMIKVGIGAVSGVLALLLGMLLQEKFLGNGSAMVLGGGAVLIITVIQLIKNSAKK